MVELPERDAALLLDKVLAARDARGFGADLDEAGFGASRLHQNAVIRSLEVIGEAAGKVAPDVRAAMPTVSWREIIGLRNRFIHGYAEVRLDRIWTIVRDDLAPLIAELEPLIPPDDPATP